MTKTQQYGQPAAAVTHWRVPATGDLVACARLWLTRRGDLADHVLHPGERVRLARGDDIVIEALHQDLAPLWRWQATAQSAMGMGWRAWLVRTVGSTKTGSVQRPDSCMQI